MATNTQKPTRLLKAIEDQLSVLVPTATVVHAFDGTTFDESIAITYTAKVYRVRIRAEAAPASGTLDGLGLTQRVYSPDLIQVGIDISGEGAGLTTDCELMKQALAAIIYRKDCRVQWFAKSSIALTDMVDGDASLVLTVNPGNETGVWGYQGNI
jgi:hypothetical protein